jgi:hypothetical protein
VSTKAVQLPVLSAASPAYCPPVISNVGPWKNRCGRFSALANTLGAAAGARLPRP